MILSPSTLMAMALSTAQTQHQRDILVVTRGRVDIPSEVRALAQCATAALHLQTGMRQNTKLWLSLPDRGSGLTLACNGKDAQMLPVMGKTIKQILEASSDSLERLTLPPGWQVHCGDTLDQRLAYLMAKDPCRRLIVVDGSGISPLFTSKVLAQSGSDGSGSNIINSSTVVVLAADASGYTDSETEGFDLFDGVLASVSPLPLLPSHSIVLAHAVLDGAEN